MIPAADLDALKADLPALLSVLGAKGPGNHLACRFCGNADALSVHQTEAGWHFRCHRCEAAGTVIDAVALAEGCTPADAIRRLTGEAYTPKAAPACTPPKPVEPVPPVPDRARLHAYQAGCIEAVFNRHALAVQYAGRRGIGLDTLLRFCVGFDADRRAWTFPIEHAGRIVALKFHREDPPADKPKSGWCCFGTQPPEKPKHGISELWPCPEAFGRGDWLFIAEGELKALAIITAGRAAIAPTTGAGFTWKPWHLIRLAGRRVCVLFDDDEAGYRFRDNTLTALANTALELKAVTFGRKENRNA